MGAQHRPPGHSSATKWTGSGAQQSHTAHPPLPVGSWRGGSWSLSLEPRAGVVLWTGHCAQSPLPLPRLGSGGGWAGPGLSPAPGSSMAQSSPMRPIKLQLTPHPRQERHPLGGRQVWLLRPRARQGVARWAGRWTEKAGSVRGKVGQQGQPTPRLGSHLSQVPAGAPCASGMTAQQARPRQGLEVLGAQGLGEGPGSYPFGSSSSCRWWSCLGPHSRALSGGGHLLRPHAQPRECWEDVGLISEDPVNRGRRPQPHWPPSRFHQPPCLCSDCSLPRDPGLRPRWSP